MCFLLRWRRKHRGEMKAAQEMKVAEEVRAAEEMKANEEMRVAEEMRAAEETRTATEMEAAEVEKRMQTEKLDKQQAQALLLTLYKLKQTVDPLIAAQVYNKHFCPFGRLPEELFLCIISFLQDDAVTLHCLRIASRIFFRLLDCHLPIWRDEWYWLAPGRRGARTTSLRSPLDLQFRHLLQRDGRCNSCRRWNDANPKELYNDCKFRQAYRHTNGAYSPRLYQKLYCNACGNHHDICQFPSIYQQENFQGERRCLGQQGSVQLCEHVYITWASIMTHINDWQRQEQHKGGVERGGPSWQTCLDSFIIECHESIHDIRCITSERPTWPRARLRCGELDKTFVVLVLEWMPHSRINTLSLRADGRIPASELRALFQRLRRLGPADTLYTPARPGALPEMAYFSPSPFTEFFVYYKKGEDDSMPLPPPTPPPWLRPLPLPPCARWWLQCRKHMNRDQRMGANGQTLYIRPHYVKGARGTSISQQCLAVSYRKVIRVCETMALTNPAVKINPPEHWLHAMDAHTYPYPQGHSVKPPCRDKACKNYYLRPKGEYSDYDYCPWGGFYDAWLDKTRRV